MKHNHLFVRIGCAVIAAILSIHSISAFASSLEDGNNTIIIHSVSNDPHGAPRDIVPFVAEYSDILSAVMLGSNASIGDVTVTLVSTAGDWYQTVFDTSEGAILIPASGDSGHYTMTLVTQDGHTFVGEFDL